MPKQSKKRKHEETSDQQLANVDEHVDENIDGTLFNEMTNVNDQLLSLSKKVKLVGHHYFVNNNCMIDEFVGNINEFLKELDVHRRRVSSDQLNSDNLFHIYQFLDIPVLMNSCQLVSKMWRETLKRLSFKVRLGTASYSRRKSVKVGKEEITSLLDGPFIKNVTSLSLFSAGVDTFQVLSNCKKLENLTKLNLASNNMGIQSVKNLKKCSMKNLTKLNLANVKKFTEKEAKELLNSSFMSSVKKLDLTSHDFPKSFLQIISESKYLNQLTHLELAQHSQSGNEDYGLTELLKDKVNLEYLGIRNHRLTLYPNFWTSLTNITRLDLSYCSMPNSEFVNLIVSPSLPKLTTLKAENFNWGNANIFGGPTAHYRQENSEVVQCPPNSQSSLTDLNLKSTYISTFPSLSYHCPNLKRLTISHSSARYCENKNLLKSSYETFLSAPTLSNLEYLDISDLACLESLFEIIFDSPVFSNLKELICQCCNMDGINLYENLVSKCTNLVNLRKIDAHSVSASKACVKALQTNPTFAKLRKVSINSYGKMEELLSYWNK
ncbi:hypothetical protein NAEGRDRAFT_52719 [Naegleria gruberi]|uniref:F-box domain-containing protein n=1 Tax=Naegleria gruberi TaxID=5762 RepID=D2VW38_NAEGR|nr:uncharacterized protein NAEGRDRAFT_52719 [Naegleria gruberi]EFC39011.1 hypothetical protein NAEGRDRAFT_52719 [Naegleria gruberi]|eukprot:XP_002671755.1 hypothetical protein NAEGRDRAFT_52719 [Naegleria gruberi strain NEG-M]